MIPVYSDTLIYILCPPDFATGGPEVLHQLNYKLRISGFNSVMYYYPAHHESPVHPEYQLYNPPFEITLQDDSKNILIIPETYTGFLIDNKLKHIRIVIWWLSIDNFFAILNEKIRFKAKKSFFRIKRWIGRYKFADLKFLKKSKIHHLAQSHYALEFLNKKGFTNVHYLSDYLNPVFIEKSKNVDFAIPRENNILYNPKKGIEFTELLIATAPELTWIPLVNMTRNEVIELLLKSKVYVDFGNHPGKDRFPREAAIMGCCVITGREGSAKYSADVPIPDNFKSENNPAFIIKTIKNCIHNYNECVNEFSYYRDIISREEQIFESDILKIFLHQ